MSGSTLLSSSSSSIGIRPVSIRTDGAVLRDIWLRCFRDEPSVRWTYHIPSSTADANPEDRTRAAESAKRAYCSRLLVDDKQHLFFAYDADTAEVVGVSGWQAPQAGIGLSSSLRRRPLGSVGWLRSRFYAFWDGAIRPLLSRFTLQRHIQQKKHDWAGVQARFEKDGVRTEDVTRGYWTLSWLGVRDDYGRRGIGKRLLQWGLDRADQEDRAVYLSASPQGVGLYSKAGFVPVVQHDAYHGQEAGGWVETFMRRPRRTERHEHDIKV